MKNRLEELRKQRAIRQEDLAQALGVSRQTVISLEKGKYNPSLALAFKLARYFGLPVMENPNMFFLRKNLAFGFSFLILRSER